MASGPLVLLSGERGVGKSTVCRRLAALWWEQGGRPGGIFTRAAGLERYVVDVTTGEERLLAAEGQELSGPRWGRFSFSQQALDWGNEVVRRAVEGPADLVLLDEVGPLELVVGGGFRPALNILIGTGKASLAVVRPALLERVRALAPARAVCLFEVTRPNRDGLAAHIAARLGSGR